MTEAQAVTWAGNNVSTYQGKTVTWNSATQVGVFYEVNGAWVLSSVTWAVSGQLGPIGGDNEPVIIIVK